MFSKEIRDVLGSTIWGLTQIQKLFPIVSAPSTRDAFLYSQETGEEAPFEVALRLTTQKLILSKELARLIYEMNGRGKLDILDIGSSKGTLLAMIVGQLLASGYKGKIDFTLLEPDSSSAQALKGYADVIKDASMGRIVSTVVQEGWEEFEPKQHDAVICSHTLYHFSPKEFDGLFAKMINVVRPGGRLFVVARERTGNDVFELIQKYKALATGEKFNEITIQDALPSLERIVQSDPLLTMAQYQMNATVLLPFVSDMDAAQKTMAFFLQRPSWETIPLSVKENIMQNYGGRDNILTQVDTIVAITKAQTSLPVKIS